MGCSHFCYYTQQNPNTQELTASNSTFFQGPGATWLWSQNRSSLQGRPAAWGCGSSHRDTRTCVTQDQTLPPQRGRCKPGCEVQHAQLQACVPPLIEGSFPDRKEEAHSTCPKPHSECTAKEPQPSHTDHATQLVRAATQNCRSLHLGSREKRNQQALSGIIYRLLDK